MRPPRYSIAGLLALVAVCGVAFASLRSPSYLWANTTFSVALGTLILATINVVYSAGRARAFWAGFLIAGGMYFAICSVPLLKEGMCPRLFTEFAFDLLYSRLNPGPPPAPAPAPTIAMTGSYMVMPQPVNQPTAPSMPGYVVALQPPGPLQDPLVAWPAPELQQGVGYEIGSIRLVSSEPFRQIGHALTALLCGVVGGWYARHRYSSRASVQTETPAG